MESRGAHFSRTIARVPSSSHTLCDLSLEIITDIVLYIFIHTEEIRCVSGNSGKVTPVKSRVESEENWR